MSPLLLSLVVLRTSRLDDLRRFYECLGLQFVDEQHGRGPAHVSATLASGTVIELYPSTSDEAIVAGTASDVRLGFQVSDLAVAVDAVRASAGAVISEHGQGAVVSDPDGRKVELTVRRDEEAIADAYWRHYRDDDVEQWAWDLVDEVGRGRGDGSFEPLVLFAELARVAPDSAALAYLGAGPLEDYLSSDLLDVQRLTEALLHDEQLSHAFRAAYLPNHLAPEDDRRLSALLNTPPNDRRSSER